MKRFWTEQELAILRRDYPNLPTKVIAESLGRSVAQIHRSANWRGLVKTPEYLASPDACRLRRGDNVGREHRFRKGQEPPNKGLRRPGWGPGRMKETQFRKGERRGRAAINWCPIGTVKADDEGYLRIKVRDAQHGKEATGFGNTKVWPLLNRYVWKRHNGTIPPSHAVVFKDGNRQNCDISNLELISRQELMARNTVHRLPKELAEVIQLKGALKRKIRNIDGGNKEQNQRPTQPSL